MFITHPLLLLRPNLSRPEQERVVQICSHILSVSANKLFHVFNGNMQVLGKVDAGFTQWRGTMLSVSLAIGFVILLILTFFNQELVSSLLAISKADVKSGSLPQGIYKRRLYQCMLNLATAKKCHYQVRAGRRENFENKSKIFYLRVSLH